MQYFREGIKSANQTRQEPSEPIEDYKPLAGDLNEKYYNIGNNTKYMYIVNICYIVNMLSDVI